MILEIKNKSSNNIAYTSTIPSTLLSVSEEKTITVETDIIKLCLDEKVWNHLINGKIVIGDGISKFKGPLAITYLKEMAQLLMLKKIAAIV